MKMFGSECAVYEQNRKKLDPKGKKGIFVGCDRHSPAYIIYFPEKNKVQKHQLVQFVAKDVTESQTAACVGKIAPRKKKYRLRAMI